jgi:hypothetical protein
VVRARRAFVVVWIVLTVAGALDQTVAESLFGRRFDLLLPHLKYGHVMFNKNPRTVQVLGYAGSDGVRHDLADLVATPALGYARARLAVDQILQPYYIAEVCLRTQRRARRELEFIVDDWDVGVGTRHLTATHRYRCEQNGVLRR